VPETEDTTSRRPLYAMPGERGAQHYRRELMGMLTPVAGKDRQPFGSDMSPARLGRHLFYYPDAMCLRILTLRHGWRSGPPFSFGILSDETGRLDEREKRFAVLLDPEPPDLRPNRTGQPGGRRRAAAYPAAWESEKLAGSKHPPPAGRYPPASIGGLYEPAPFE